MGARELVLGGEGLIGVELVRLLQARGATVRSLDLREGVDVRECGPEPFEWADRVWFLAWDNGGAKFMLDPGMQHEIYFNNATLTAHVFDLVHSIGTPTLFAATQLSGQRNAYGVTKLLGERWAEAIGVKVARLWNTYGWEVPSQRSHVVPDFVLAALTGGPIRCQTDGSEQRRFLYKGDCARALTMLFDSELEYADIAGPEWISMKELAMTIARIHDVDVEFGEVPGGEAFVEPVALVPGWAPEITLEEGLRRVADEAALYVAQETRDVVGKIGRGFESDNARLSKPD